MSLSFPFPFGSFFAGARERLARASVVDVAVGAGELSGVAELVELGSGGDGGDDEPEPEARVNEPSAVLEVAVVEG